MENNEGKNIFDFYCEYTENKRIKYTKSRQTLMKSVLKEIKGYEAVGIIHYIFESEDEYALYMRNNNYCSFENIFRITKLADKDRRAKLWLKSKELPEDDFGWEIK